MNNEDICYSQSEQNKREENTTIKKIFLNLFIIFFIIIIYFYFSESVGSISSYYIINKFSTFQFGFTLLSFIFLSNLAGSFRSAIAGFFGELLYQIIYYNDLQIQWCLIVALIGFFIGLYKYNPLKYKKKLNLLYNSILSITFSIIIFLSIIIFQIIVEPTNILEDIIYNYGLKFLIQFIISIPLIIPFLIFMYDYILAEKEYHFYNMTLTHHPEYACDHTFYLKFGKTYIYFCSRCSGTLLGALFTFFTMYILFRTTGFILTPESALIICIIFPIPCIIDWGIQRLFIRESNTKSRLITGFIIGISLYAISFGGSYSPIIIFLVIFYLSIVGLLMYIGYKLELKRMETDDDNLYDGEEIFLD
ncbi:MAG: DUF2085 domain-containing protein [Candidatus Lokiarchaeota archaeon]|nr:DUF2085 domain-containing protein [Candidatus Lokiarchaeota archaeon]